MQRFPEDFGTELAGKSFEEIFTEFPKWVACVEHTWTENCTGLFEEFRNYILLRLQDPVSRIEHDQRCYDYVKTLTLQKMPSYLIKYASRSVPSTEI